ncbi:MAG: ice-binding family protein [Patescibacteria group bacterium]
MVLLVGVVGFVSIFAAGGIKNLVALGGPQVAAAASSDLSSAANFGVLAGSAISDAGGSTVVGDLGLSPTTGAAITGILAAQVTGTIYDVDGTGPLGTVQNPGLLTVAQSDLSSAYNAIASQTLDASISGIGGGQTLTPGVYNSASSISFNGSLTLDAGGDANAVFIFQAGSTLTTGSASTVILAGNAQACNVFWQVGSSATLGTGSTFKGTILAMDSITDNGGSTVEGRLLARNAAVSLNNTHIVVPGCSHPPAFATLHIIKVIANTNGTGTSTPSDFMLHVLHSGTDVVGSPQVGSTSPGTSYSVAAGSYTVTEDPGALYTQSFSGDCDATGAVTLAAGASKNCTVTNTDIAALSTSTPSTPSTSTPPTSDVGTSGGGGHRRPVSESIPTATTTPVTSVTTDTAPTTSTPVYYPVTSPSFPDTGFPPRGK